MQCLCFLNGNGLRSPFVQPLPPESYFGELLSLYIICTRTSFQPWIRSEIVLRRLNLRFLRCSCTGHLRLMGFIQLQGSFSHWLIIIMDSLLALASLLHPLIGNQVHSLRFGKRFNIICLSL